jgi:hypothetical protein
MIRDPSDGSVKEKPVVGNFPTTEISGLPMTRDKAEYLARLELSREWLQNYHQRSASTST